METTKLQLPFYSLDLDKTWRIQFTTECQLYNVNRKISEAWTLSFKGVLKTELLQKIESIAGLWEQSNKTDR